MAFLSVQTVLFTTSMLCAVCNIVSFFLLTMWNFTSNMINSEPSKIVCWWFQGVRRVFKDMPEICVDVPEAYALLERLGNKLYGVGVLTDDLMKEMPARWDILMVVLGWNKLNEQDLIIIWLWYFSNIVPPCYIACPARPQIKLQHGFCVFFFWEGEGGIFVHFMDIPLLITHGIVAVSDGSLKCWSLLLLEGDSLVTSGPNDLYSE